MHLAGARCLVNSSARQAPCLLSLSYSSTYSRVKQCCGSVTWPLSARSERCCTCALPPDFSDAAATEVPPGAQVLATNEEGVVLYPLAPNQPSPRKLMLAIQGAHTLQHLQQLLTQHGSWYTQRHLTATLNSLARQLQQPPTRPQQLPPAVQAQVTALLQAVGGLLVQQADELDPQALCNALHCCAKLGHRDATLVRCLLEVAAFKLGEFNDQNTSMLLHALVELGCRPDDTLAQQLMVHLQQRAYMLGDQALANCMWALAKLRLQPPPGTLHALQEQAVAQLQAPGYSAQHLGMLVWGLAKLQVLLEPELGEALLLCADQLVADMTNKDLAFWLWGASMLQLLLPSRLVQACCRQGLAHVDDMQAVAAVHILHGLARQRQLRRRALLERDGGPIPKVAVERGDWPGQSQEQLVVELLQLLQPQLASLTTYQLSSVVLSVAELSGLHWQLHMDKPGRSHAHPSTARRGRSIFEQHQQQPTGSPRAAAAAAAVEPPVLLNLPPGWLAQLVAAVQQHGAARDVAADKAWGQTVSAAGALQQCFQQP